MLLGLDTNAMGNVLIARTHSYVVIRETEATA